MLYLKIISPEKVEFKGEVRSVKVPGLLGPFEVLTDHAPIISVLDKGEVEYVTDNESSKLLITGGFIQVKSNQIDLCVEIQ